MISLLLRVVSSIRELSVIGKERKPLLHPYDYHATLVIVVVHRHHSWVGLLLPSLLLKLAWYFLIPGSLEPLSAVHGIFSKRNLPSTSGEEPRTIAIVCNIWGVSWATLANNSKEGFSMESWGFS